MYQILGILQIFQISICSAHFSFYDISIPVVRRMLTMENIV